MDMQSFLSEVIQRPGLPGNEGPVAEYIRDAFAPYAAEVSIDSLYNVIARLPGEGGGPKVMITAHLDEIGLIVTDIEPDGCLRFWQMGGVDPRILPASEVTVLADPPLFGVVGVKPPHLLSDAERQKNYSYDNLYIDVGLSEAQAREQIPVGTPVQLTGNLMALADDRICGKTFDDRACVAMLLMAAEQLSKTRHQADVFFVLAAQEEVGSRGATTAAYALAPDIGIAVDVTHGEMPGTAPNEAYSIDKVVLTAGPNIHPKVHAAMLAKAKDINVDTVVSICPHVTHTDADPLQVARAGIPTALVELPLKYMHTTVELCAEKTVSEAARLIAAYVADLDEQWEAALCF